MSFSFLLVNLFQDMTPVAGIVVGLILVMLVLSILITLRTLGRYAMEEVNINRMERNIDIWRDNIGKEVSDKNLGETDEEGLPNDTNEIPTDEISLLQDSPNTKLEYQPIIDPDRLLEGLSKQSLIRQRVEIIKRLKQFRIKIDVTVLQNLAIANESRHWIVKIPAFFSGLAMLLGMLGTFWGLMMMVSEIGGQLSAIDEAEFGNLLDRLQGIRGVLAGVGTAFYTTIAGLICTILTSIMNFLIEKTQLNLFERLETFTANDLLPATLPSLEGDSMMEQISYRLQDSFDNMNDVIDRNNESLSNLNGVYESFNQIISEIRQITQREASNKLEGIILELSSVNNTMKDMISKYENRNILEEIKGLGETNKSLVETYNSRLNDAKWLVSTRGFMIAISVLLGIISLTMITQIFIA